MPEMMDREQSLESNRQETAAHINALITAACSVLNQSCNQPDMTNLDTEHVATDISAMISSMQNLIMPLRAMAAITGDQDGRALNVARDLNDNFSSFMSSMSTYVASNGSALEQQAVFSRIQDVSQVAFELLAAIGEADTTLQQQDNVIIMAQNAARSTQGLSGAVNALATECSRHPHLAEVQHNLLQLGIQAQRASEVLVASSIVAGPCLNSTACRDELLKSAMALRDTMDVIDQQSVALGQALGETQALQNVRQQILAANEMIGQLIQHVNDPTKLNLRVQHIRRVSSQTGRPLSALSGQAEYGQTASFGNQLQVPSIYGDQMYQTAAATFGDSSGRNSSATTPYGQQAFSSRSLEDQANSDGQNYEPQASPRSALPGNDDWSLSDPMQNASSRGSPTEGQVQSPHPFFDSAEAKPNFVAAQAVQGQMQEQHNSRHSISASQGHGAAVQAVFKPALSVLTQETSPIRASGSQAALAQLKASSSMNNFPRHGSISALAQQSPTLPPSPSQMNMPRVGSIMAIAQQLPSLPSSPSQMNMPRVGSNMAIAQQLHSGSALPPSLISGDQSRRGSRAGSGERKPNIAVPGQLVPQEFSMQQGHRQGQSGLVQQLQRPQQSSALAREFSQKQGNEFADTPFGDGEIFENVLEAASRLLEDGQSTQQIIENTKVITASAVQVIASLKEQAALTEVHFVL
jgi:hypothetical protein